jgi:OmpA-OmpF porin, OOP family
MHKRRLVPAPLSSKPAAMLEAWKKANDDDRTEWALLALVLLLLAGGVGFTVWKHVSVPDGDGGKAVPSAPKAMTMLSVAIAPAKLTLSGRIPNEAARAKLLAAAKKSFPNHEVNDRLQVEKNPDAARWVTAAETLLGSCNGIRWGLLTANSNSIGLRGEIATEELATELKKTAAGLNPKTVTKTSVNVTVPELKVVAPPKVDPAKLKEEITKDLEGKTVEFETGSDKLTAKGKKIVDELVPMLKELQGLRVTVSGHTDNKGDSKANMELSEKRAAAVIEYLGSQGIDKTHLVPKGFGDTKPKASNESEEGRSQNRRIEFLPEESHGQ